MRGRRLIPFDGGSYLDREGLHMAQVVYETKACMRCRQKSQVTVDADALKRWQSGELVQRAFPLMTPDERELLITGTHPECWRAMFRDEDDED